MSQPRNFISFCVFALCLILSSCEKDLLTEYPQEYAGEMIDVADFSIVSYNIHGGLGPNGEGDFQSNVAAFKQMLQEESIICLQEVEPDCWNQLKAIFSEFEFRYYLPQKSTKFGTHKKGGNAIFSKFPIVAYDQQLIQTDPGGDKWERRAQYVKIHIGLENQYLNLFHYHNTYNWHENNSASEKAGLQKFVNYFNSKGLSESEMNVLIGDFNVNQSQAYEIIPTSEFLNSQSNWVDHIYTNGSMLSGGHYATFEATISDHQAVWSTLCNEDC